MEGKRTLYIPEKEIKLYSKSSPRVPSFFQVLGVLKGEVQKRSCFAVRQCKQRNPNLSVSSSLSSFLEFH